MNNTLYHLWKSDLYRYEGKTGIKIFLKHFFLSPGYKYSFFMRLCNKLASTKYMYPAWILSILFLMHYETKYGISIPFKTNIGKGFYIGHFGTIIVSSKSTIGNNCNISQGVTIGVSVRGKNKGYPTIGNEVYIGPGAKIIGKIFIGNNVSIGANCVVTKDIPDNAVVVGIPGNIISYKGSEGYINNIV